ncbi:MAG: ABC transporter ATP-binding protein, partial [Bradyrhizobiaceae bacterium]
IKIGNRILLLSPHPGQVKAELNGGVHGEEAAELEHRIQTMLFADTIEEAENV